MSATAWSTRNIKKELNSSSIIAHSSRELRIRQCGNYETWRKSLGRFASTASRWPNRIMGTREAVWSRRVWALSYLDLCLNQTLSLNMKAMLAFSLIWDPIPSSLKYLPQSIVWNISEKKNTNNKCWWGCGERGHSYTVAVNSLLSCPTLCERIDGSPPGSPVPEILQARTLEWVAIFFSDMEKWPRDK